MSKITTQFYQVYYRKTDHVLLENIDGQNPFIKVKNPPFKWIADPFLFEKDGKEYIFAECANFFNSKGDIYYICLNDSKPKWKLAIQNKFHMSFPNIFNNNGSIFMIPETNKDGCVAIYKCESFPNVWRKEKELLNEPYTDSILIENKNLLCSYDDKKFKLYFYKQEDNEFKEICVVDDSQQLLRPAGKCFDIGGKTIVPFQNNSKHYAGGIIFKEIIFDGTTVKIGDVIKEFSINDARIALNTKKIFGTHTYNKIKNFEVIDVLTSKFTLIGLLGKIRTKLLKL